MKSVRTHRSRRGHAAHRPLLLDVLEDRRLLSINTEVGAGHQPFVPGEILIGFEGDIPAVWRTLGADRALEMAGSHAAGLKLASGKILQHLPAQPNRAEQVTTSWKLPPGVDVLEAVKRLTGQPGVVYAEPNYIVSVALTPQSLPDDPRFDDLWGMDNTGQTGGLSDADINAPEAWYRHTGSGNIVVGVIDTGVNYTHGDLAPNIWVNAAEIPDNGLDDDSNGYVDDVHGWDFVNNDNDPDDDNKHGTHVAGTIGAVGNNGVGVTGVNWDIQIMPLKFLNNRGSGTTEDAVRALDYATNMRLAGVNIVLTNNSWGGGASSQALRSAIEASADANMLFVAAAGNTGGGAILPAAYDLDNIISVAATDHADQLASFSSRGSNVDLGAPGDEILSTMRNSYGTLSGTSMASPHVAGVAALAWDYLKESGYSPDYQEVRDLIYASVDPLPSLAGLTMTGGRLNAYDALFAADVLLGTETSISISDVSQLEGDSGETLVELTISRTGDLEKTTTVHWATSTGTADPTSDYTPVNDGVVVFESGVAAVPIQVSVAGDTDEEPHETLFVDLLDADNAWIVDRLAVATILNDDTTISVSGAEVTEGDGRVVLLDELVPAGRSGLDYPNALEYGPDLDGDGAPEHLYVVNWYGRNVLRFDAQSGTQGEVFVAARSGGLDRPNQAAFGPDGNLYVVDSSAHAVFRFDGTTGLPLPAIGKSKATFVSSGDGGLSGPRGIAFDSAGDLYVTSYDTDEVIKFHGPGDESEGGLIGTFVSAGSGGLDFPRGLVIGLDGHLYVGSYATDAILRFDGTSGAPLPADGMSGADFVPAGSGGLDLPYGFRFVDHDGDGSQDLFVASAGTDEILRYNGTSGDWIEAYVPGGAGGLDRPTDLQFTPDGNLLVSSAYLDDVLRFGVASQAVFAIRLSAPVAGEVRVDVSTNDGTATTDIPGKEDYVRIPASPPRTIVFGPDEVASSVLVAIVEDDIAEPGDPEYFTVQLSNVAGATEGNMSAAGVILDDETLPPPPTNDTDMYVWDIDLSSGRRGRKDVEWIRVTVRRDSIHNGIAELGDAVVTGATVTVNLIGEDNSTIRTVSGVTSEGLFEQWINPLSPGLYAAEVVSVVHDTYAWNQTLDPVVGNDTDTNANDFPEQWYLVNAAAAAIAALPHTSSPSTENPAVDGVVDSVASDLDTAVMDWAVQMDDTVAVTLFSRSFIIQQNREASSADTAIQELDLDPLPDELLEELAIIL